MPVTKQTTTERLNIAPAGSIEQTLLRLATGIYSQMAANPESPVDLASILSPELSPGLTGAIEQQRAAAVAGGMAGLDQAFTDSSNQIYNSAAARGVLDSSFTATELGQARRGYLAGAANIQTSAAATAAERIQQAILQQMGVRASIREGDLNRRLALTDPGLLRGLQGLRLSSAERTVTSTTDTGYDPTALLSGLNGVGSGIGFLMNRPKAREKPNYGPYDY